MNKDLKRYLITTIAVICSSLIQVFVIQVFVTPANLLSSGFTGVAILVDRIATLYGGHFPTSVGLVLFNLPVAILCYRSIGKKFVFFSLTQVFLTSFFLTVMNFQPLFNDIVLNVCFGGFLYGLGTVLALRGNASTGGTDFIALYISNKKHKSIWEYVFVFNTIILCIFGMIFGWAYAGYSIVFQYISTKTIDTFYERYKRVTLQMTTKYPEDIVKVYTQHFHHGISVVNGYGGYSHQPMSLLHTVVSTYEKQDIVHLLMDTDPHIIINVLSTETFYGGFYQKPLD